MTAMSLDDGGRFLRPWKDSNLGCDFTLRPATFDVMDDEDMDDDDDDF